MSTYRFGTKGAPAVGGGLGGLPWRSDSTAESARGERIFISAGTYEISIPSGVTSICALCVGAGGGSYANGGSSGGYTGGAGGALAYVNEISVRPGEKLKIIVGAGGKPGSNGGDSTIWRGSQLLFGAGGGSVGKSGLASGGAPINGELSPQGGYGGYTHNNGFGTSWGGGGGAGGYSGDGGHVVSGAGGNTNGTGGGGGGGGPTSTGQVSGGGGGVGLFGQGNDGYAGQTSSTGCGGGGGSGGADGSWGTSSTTASGGAFGGGGGIGSNFSLSVGMSGGGGAVRILWGAGRAFPSTDVGAS